MCNVFDEYEMRGRKLEAERINLLNRILLKAKRFADLERSANEPEYQAQLMKELLPAN